MGFGAHAEVVGDDGHWRTRRESRDVVVGAASLTGLYHCAGCPVGAHGRLRGLRR